MFDNLREQADSTPFYEDEAQFRDVEDLRPKAPPPRNTSSGGGRFLGMTPLQRFILAILLLISVCVLGSMCLLITGRISLF
ncbi:MAG TPA: hypothetical protein VF784_03755 [Anaerolineales bacterium]